MQRLYFGKDSSIVYQDIYLTKSFYSFSYNILYFCIVSDICWNGNKTYRFSSYTFKSGLIFCSDYNTCTFFCKKNSGGLTNSSAASSYNGNFSRELGKFLLFR